MTDKYDYIIVNLKVIAQLPRNRRLTTTPKGYFTLEGNHLLVPIKRKIYGEGRDKLVRDVKSLLLETDGQVKLLLTKFGENPLVGDAVASSTSGDEKRLVAKQLSGIHRELHRSITGFESLKATYESDILMVGELENVMDRVRSLMAEIEEKYPDVGENILPVMLEK